MTANGFERPQPTGYGPGYPPPYVQQPVVMPGPAIPAYPPVPEPEPPVNYELVKELRQQVGKALLAQGAMTGSAEDQRRRAEQPVMNAVVRSGVDERIFEATRNAVLDLMFGAGGLQQYLDDERIENIDINGMDTWIAYADQPYPKNVGPVAASLEGLVELIRTLASGITTGAASRSWDSASPMLDFSMPGGLRFSAVMELGQVPTVSIRRNRMKQAFLADLVANGTLLPVTASFLQAAVLARKNVIVAGETNAGKTTLLRAMINAIPSHERLLTVEKAAELGVHEARHPEDGYLLHPNTIAFETRLPNSEGLGEVGMRDLVRRSLRMNPSRVIVGEVLGDEMSEMLKAMSQGNDGSLSTIHTNSASAVFDRIALYAMQGPEQMRPEVAHGLTAAAVNFVVYIRRHKTSGTGGQYRFVSDIREVNGLDEKVLSSSVFAPGRDGRAVPTSSQISCIDELVACGFEYTGV